MKQADRIRRHFLKAESERVNKKVQQIRKIVNEVLQDEFNRNLYRLKIEDDLRLLILFTWRERYNVPIKWMLKLLITIWSKRFSRFVAKPALGCTVSVLTGKKSEVIVADMAIEEFGKTKEREIQAREAAKQRIEKRISEVYQDKRHHKKHKSIREIKESASIETFVKNYSRELKSWRKSKQLTREGRHQMHKLQSKNFRTSPYQ